MLSREKYDQALLSIACSMEFLHTASIILDDLPSMDNALLRRGKKTTHLIFGEAKTVLAALWLCDVAQRLVRKSQLDDKQESQFDLEDAFRLTKSRLIMGQTLDLQGKRKSAGDIIKMYTLKSGAFYALVAATPARLLRMQHLIKPFQLFGNYLGIAYQISDDIADQISTEKSLGKDTHKDDGKCTIPQVLGMKQAVRLRTHYAELAIAQLRKLPFPTKNITRFATTIIYG